MKVCDDCGRNHYGTGNYCSSCYKRRRNEGVNRNREYEIGKPSTTILMKMIDIHYLCNCTWVYDHSTGLHRLKYRNMGCIAMYWHNTIMNSSVNSGQELGV